MVNVMVMGAGISMVRVMGGRHPMKHSLVYTGGVETIIKFMVQVRAMVVVMVIGMDRVRVLVMGKFKFVGRVKVLVMGSES